MRKLFVALAALVPVLLAAPAFGHVTVQPNEAPIGAFFRFVVRVPTERPDAATTKVEVRFPDLIFVSFQPKDGWKRKVTMRTLDTPIEAFGEEITEVIDTVTWTGGRIEPGEFDEFGFSARVPEEGTTLEFPAIQTYSSGEVVRWIGPPDSETPAALVNAVDFGAQEGQGELGVISQLRQEVAQLRSQGGDPSDDGGSSGLALALGAIGTLLGGGALATALANRRRSARPVGEDQLVTTSRS